MIPADAIQRVDSVVIAPLVTIMDAVRQLDAAGTGALLVCTADHTLRGLVTDGDIRRAMLRGVAFTESVESIAISNPLVASADISQHAALELMDHALEFPVNHLPLVAPDGRAAGLLLRRDLVTREQRPLSALIMAGGFGVRMLPLTERTPKPMLPVGGRPLLERTIRTLSRTGIRRVVISTHHLAERITSHFGDGHDYGIDLEYVTETLPLGTAGALRLVNQTGPLLVVNGDILTRVDFDDLVEFHRQQGAELTVGMRRCELQLPYGVLDCDGPHVRTVREKPSESFWVNAGIYLVEPSIRDLIPHGERFDMTDLIDRMLADGRPVAGFPIVEYWLDIGQPADYLRAQADAEPAGVAQ
jgi:dTDP-glucose pyrophosphorylase/CBS domain-containing protein